MINSIKAVGNAIADTISTNRISEVFQSIIKSLSMPEKTKSLLCDLARVTPMDPPSKPGGGFMTICDLYPDLSSQEIDFLMSQYQGNMERG